MFLNDSAPAPNNNSYYNCGVAKIAAQVAPATKDLTAAEEATATGSAAAAAAAAAAGICEATAITQDYKPWPPTAPNLENITTSNCYGPSGSGGGSGAYGYNQRRRDVSLFSIRAFEQKEDTKTIKTSPHVVFYSLRSVEWSAA